MPRRRITLTMSLCHRPTGPRVPIAQAPYTDCSWSLAAGSAVGSSCAYRHRGRPLSTGPHAPDRPRIRTARAPRRIQIGPRKLARCLDYWETHIHACAKAENTLWACFCMYFFNLFSPKKTNVHFVCIPFFQFVLCNLSWICSCERHSSVAFSINFNEASFCYFHKCKITTTYI